MNRLIEALLDPTLTFGEAEKEASAHLQIPSDRNSVPRRLPTGVSRSKPASTVDDDRSGECLQSPASSSSGDASQPSG